MVCEATQSVVSSEARMVENTPAAPQAALAAAVVRPAPSRFQATPRDLVALTKPRITTIVLATCGAGIALAPGAIATSRLWMSLVGTVLVVSAANALNMWWERDVDGFMTRTKNRPLPAGRMGAGAALAFGLLLGAIAVPMLFAVNALTGALGLLALVSYVAVYTPLKRHTPFALQVGAVPGAIPPLLGWTSVTGNLDAGGLILFGILFFWQVPHFVAISLFRTEEYARAGMKVHAVANGVRSSKATIVLYTLILIALTVLPVPFGIAGGRYLAVSLVLGALFLAIAVAGYRPRAEPAGEVRWARQLFGFSIVYLMVLLGSLLADHAHLS